MNRREFLTTAAVVPAAALLAGRPGWAATVRLKWAVFTPDSERTFVTVMKPYAATVEKDSGGAVAFDMFPNGALGRNPGQQPQMVVDGVADVGWMVPSYTPGRFPDTEVLELPGLFRDIRESTIVAARMGAGDALHDYGDFHVVALFGTAPYSVHTNFPVKTVADLRDKKIRASSATESEALRALGAVPVGMPVTAIPEAIGRHTIDGTTSHMSPFFDFGLDRVTNYHLMIHLGIVPLAILMNKKKFDALPKEAQDAIVKNGGVALAGKFVDSIGPYNAGLLKRLQDDPKHHVIFPTEAEEAAVQAKLAPVRDAWVAKSPRHKELKTAVDAEIARYRKA
ncbi:MAG TPA: TRAP transporter substrate-binding protein [Hyphomicrobiales bacterium]|nr:TRAP transporter substrate-binding protein [Hyphomicrobiales bacterium]